MFEMALEQSVALELYLRTFWNPKKLFAYQEKALEYLKTVQQKNPRVNVKRSGITISTLQLRKEESDVWKLEKQMLRIRKEQCWRKLIALLLPSFWACFPKPVWMLRDQLKVQRLGQLWTQRNVLFSGFRIVCLLQIFRNLEKGILKEEASQCYSKNTLSTCLASNDDWDASFQAETRINSKRFLEQTQLMEFER